MTLTPIVFGVLGMVPQSSGGTGDQRKNRDHSDQSAAEISDESPGELRWLAVIQTSLKNQQLKLVWKTYKE